MLLKTFWTPLYIMRWTHLWICIVENPSSAPRAGCAPPSVTSKCPLRVERPSFTPGVGYVPPLISLKFGFEGLPPHPELNVCPIWPVSRGPCTNFQYVHTRVILKGLIKIGTCSRDCQCSTFPRQPLVLKWYQRCTTAVHL